MTHPAPPSQKAASALVPVANAALAAAIFAADTITGRGFAVSFLYVVVVLLATRFCRARGVIFVALGCAVLTQASYFLSHPGASEAEAVSNRLISLAAIAVTTLFAIYSQSAEERLSESEEQWRAVFEHNPTMFFIDATGLVLSVNPLGAEQLGYTAEELIGRPVQNLFHPDDRDAATANTARCLEQLGRAMSWELRKIRKDGQVICVRETARAILMKNRPVVLIVCDDITARKQAEDARNLLILEVDHRARNALAMVQSVACLTDASDPAYYRERVIGRVDAMARAQTALSRSHWGGAVLEEVIREELSSSATRQQFTLAGPKIMLRADQVQPISMIMHEMATNAIKHGALSVPGGTVAVSWTTNRRREVELTWKESGGPAVHQPERTGFGSRLIDRLAAQLHGSAEFGWQQTGLVATFRWRSA